MAARITTDDILEGATAIFAVAAAAVAAFLFGSFDGALYVYPAALVGVASLFWIVRIWSNRQQRFLVLPVIWPMLAFIGYAIFRYQHAEIPYFARVELAQTIVFALLGALTIQNLHRQNVMKWAVVALISAGVVLSGIAIFQCLRQSVTVFGVAKAPMYQHRYGATFMNPNHLAGFLIPLLSMSVAHLFLGRGGAQSRILFGYASVVILGGIGVTISRGGWVGAAISLGCLAVWMARRPTMRIPVAIGSVLAITGIAVVLSNSKLLSSRLDGLTDQGSKNSGYSRPWIWKPAWRMWKDNEVYGVGAGHFDVHFPAYRPSTVQTKPEFVHNEYLNILVDYGAIGAALAAVGLIVVVWSVASSAKHMERGLSDLGTRGSNRTAFFVGAWSGLIGLGMHCAMEFDLHVPAIALEAAMIGGAMLSLTRYATERYWVKTNVGLQFGISAVILVAVGWSSPVILRAADEDQHVHEANVIGKMDDKYFNLLRSAVAIEPGNPGNYYLLGESLRQVSWQGDENWRDTAGEAAQVLRKGLDINPHDARMWMSLALTAGWLGDTNSASKYFDEASKRGGEDLTIANHHSWFRLQHGDPTRAIELARSSTNWFIWGNWQPVYYISQAQAILDKQAGGTNSAPSTR